MINQQTESEQKTEIQEKYYKFMNQHKINITFFDWFEEYHQDIKNPTINMAKKKIINGKHHKE